LKKRLRNNTLKIIKELNEEVQFLEEEVAGKKNWYIQGVFLQSGIKNANGRIYPETIMENEVARYTQAKISRGRAYGELGHPNSPTINLDRVSHIVRSLTKQGKDYIGKAEIVEENPMGLIAVNLMKRGSQLGVSSRAVGSVKQVNGIMEVQSDFRLSTAADIVSDPSAPDAFVQGINEGEEWIYESGIWKQIDLETGVKRLHNTPKAELSKFKVQLFEQFISKVGK
jgi:hypothetical protein